MPKPLSDAITVFCYAAIAASAVVGYHFGWIDTTFETVVLTGTLAHLGLSYSPNGKNGTPTPPQVGTHQ